MKTKLIRKFYILIILVNSFSSMWTGSPSSFSTVYATQLSTMLPVTDCTVMLKWELKEQKLRGGISSSY
jgi:hypothetical protein